MQWKKHKKMNKFVRIFSIIWLIGVLTVINLSLSPNLNNFTSINIKPKNSEAHGKISIDGNAQLDTFSNKTGLGTLGNPYVIANYTIDAGNIGSSVSIENTDRYLILRNLTVTKSAGYGTGSGIYLKNVTNVQIEICKTPNNFHGIYFDSGSNSSISNCSVWDSTYGVRLKSSKNISLMDTNMTGCGLFLEGDLDSQVSHINSNNLVNNHPLYWYTNETGLTAANFASAGQVVLVNCTDAIISDLNVSAATIGLHLLSTNNSVITNVTSNDGVYGFHFDSETINNTVINCTTSGNYYHGQFLDSSNTTVINCTASNNNNDGFYLDFPGEFNKIINSTASSNNDDGISISNSVNNTIKNCTLFSNTDNGMEIFSSEDNSVVNCTLSGNTKEGLYLWLSDLNRIFNCSISSNTDDGIYLDNSHNNNITSCTTSGNSFYGIYLYNSNSNDIENCTIFDNTNGGLVLSSSDGNTILNGSAWNNPYGYYLYKSNYNTISSSTAKNNSLHGFYLMDHSHHNTLSNCTTNNNTMMGIRLQYASNWNKISNFTSSNNQYGLEIDESYYNNITQNEFSTNEYGLYLHTLSFDNLIWENQILNNSFHQALDNSGINQWNFSGRGNFWSDYRDRYPSAIDLGGYWDTPYSINGSRGAQDNYPLLISLVTPDSPSILTTNQTITNTSLTIEWTTVSDATSYNVYVNGTLNATTSFTQQLIGLHTNNTYEITVSAMNYEVESDQSLAISIIVAIPPVDDEENPSWLETPQNQEVEYGTSFIYDLNATDNVAIDEYWLDDIVNFQIDINGIITNISTLFPGNYNLEIFVNDTSNNIISSLIQISCVDNEAPNWIETPENQELEYGEPFMYDLNATDNVAIDEYWLDDIVNFQIDINGIITNISTLFPGYYNLEIFVNDTSNNIISSMIQISCVDNEAPKWIETPQNQVVEYGAPFIYDVNASDNFAIEEYSLNDTTYFDIDLVGVITNATILIPGTYFLEITARDIGNNQITYEISITVNPEPNSQERRKIPAYPVGFLTIWIIIAIGLLMKKSLRFQDNLST